MTITGVWRDQNGYRIRPQTLGTECHKTRPLAEALTYSESLAKITPCMQACILCPSLQPAESSWTSFEKKSLKNISLQKYTLFVFFAKMSRHVEPCPDAQPSPAPRTLVLGAWLAAGPGPGPGRPGPKIANVNFSHFPISGVKNVKKSLKLDMLFGSIWTHPS